MQASVGHRQVEHTADLALELWAESEELLLVEGARALIEILTEGVEILETSERELRIEALDDEDRLVQWLNQVLLLAILEGFLLADAELRLYPGGLEARLRGEAAALDKIRTELKSVTYHDLHLSREAGRWEARVVIDV
jgi:SHS2 domain-containing protein